MQGHSPEGLGQWDLLGRHSALRPHHSAVCVVGGWGCARGGGKEASGQRVSVVEAVLPRPRWSLV